MYVVGFQIKTVRNCCFISNELNKAAVRINFVFQQPKDSVANFSNRIKTNFDGKVELGPF